MRNFSVFSKILPFVVIASLLSLPLASIIKNPFYLTIEDPVVEVSIMANDGGPTEDYFLRTETVISFNVDLVPAEELRLHDNRLLSLVKPDLAVLPLKDIISEIFIPPRIVS